MVEAKQLAKQVDDRIDLQRCYFYRSRPSTGPRTWQLSTLHHQAIGDEWIENGVVKVREHTEIFRGLIHQTSGQF